MTLELWRSAAWQQIQLWRSSDGRDLSHVTHMGLISFSLGGFLPWHLCHLPVRIEHSS